MMIDWLAKCCAPCTTHLPPHTLSTDQQSINEKTEEDWQAERKKGKLRQVKKEKNLFNDNSLNF